MTTVNIEELKQVYNTDPKAKVIFDSYAARQRGRQDTTTPRMRRVLKEKGIDMSIRELSDFYLRMQKAGVGRCISGRKGRVNRFVWGFHLKSVAEAAQGKIEAANELAKAPKGKVKLPHLNARSEEQGTTAKSEKPQSVVADLDRKIMVRKAGFEIEFPLDMSPEDWKDAAVLLNNLG